MKKGDFVFSLDNGIGLIVDDTNDFTIQYKDKIEINVKSYKVQEISLDLVNSIESKTYENSFTYPTIQKGKAYKAQERVKSYFIIANQVNARVIGSESYSSKITFNKNSFKTECDCPVGTFCKHTYAVLSQIEDDFKILNSKRIDDKTTIISDELYDLHSKLFNQGTTKPYKILKALIPLVKYFDDKTEDEFSVYFDFIKEESKTLINYLIIGLLSNQNTVDLINNFIYDESNLIYRIFFIDAINFVNNDKSRNNNRMLYNDALKFIIYDYFKEDWHDLLKNICSIPRYFVENYDILNSIADKIDPNDSNLEKAVHKLIDFDYNHKLLPLYEKYMTVLDPYSLQKFIESNQIELSKNIITSLDSKTAVNFLTYMSNAKDAIDYVLNSDLEHKENILYNYMLQGFFIVEERILLHQLVEKFKGTKGALKICDEELKSKDSHGLTYDDFFPFFSIDYIITEEANGIEVTYSLKSLNLELMRFTYDDEFKIVCMVYMINPKNNVVNYFKEYIDKNLCDIDQKILEFKKAKEMARQQKLIADFKRSISDFTNETEEIKLADNFKVELEPHISYNDNHDDTDVKYFLSLKVGNTKMYVVKNINEFQNNLNEKNYVSYGKDLAFKHDIENFKDSSKDLVKLVSIMKLSSQYTYYTANSFRNVILDYEILDDIINQYVSRNLYINDKLYYISSEVLDFNVFIDDDFKLIPSIEMNNVFSTDKLYFIDEKELVVKRIKGSKNDVKFFKFAMKNSGLNIKPVLDEFKNEIYSRYQKYIKLSSSIINEFKLESIEIDAYFDYNQDKNVITVKYDFKKEGNIIDESCFNVVDKRVLSNFLLYLSSLGFNGSEMTDEINIISFFKMDFTYLRTLCNVYLSDVIKNKTIVKINTTPIKIEKHDSILTCFYDDDSLTDEDLERIFSGIKRRKKFVLLKNDRIVDTTSEDVIKLYDTVTDLGLDTKKVKGESEIPVYMSIKALAHQENVLIDDFINKMHNDITQFKKADIEIPEINGTLREYQKEGFYFLKTLEKYNLSAILADDMGLGKTIEVITLLKSQESLKPSLVVCPKSLIFNWKQEFNKFDPNRNVISLVGLQKDRHDLIDNMKNDGTIYLIAYDSLRNDMDLLKNIEFNYIILDEAQYIKNVNAIKTKNVKELKGDYRLALTGTPIENTIVDLWSIFDFLMPNYFSDISNFKSRFQASPEYSDVVKKKVAPFILRRTKAEVLKDLPPKIETIITCEMSKEQRTVYQAYSKLAYNFLNKNEKSGLELMKYLTKLRQVCISPYLFDLAYTGESGKLNVLYETINNYIVEDHRILVFSSFVQALNMVKDKLEELKIKYFMLTGDTKINDRIDMVNRFNSDSSIKVFLISLKAGGTGLNLVGADTVIHLDPWWNVAAENQATDRTYRIGQTRTVNVLKLVCEDSVEQRIIELQNAKKNIVDKVISNNSDSVEGFTLEDLKYILS